MLSRIIKQVFSWLGSISQPPFLDIKQRATLVSNNCIVDEEFDGVRLYPGTWRSNTVKLFMISNDLSIYTDYAGEWWDLKSPRFRSLQRITPFRLGLIEEFFGPVAGKRVADLGCGGGLLSVPLLDKGADVTGVDISMASISVARDTARGRGTFIVGDICHLTLPPDSFDLVLLMDVIEHIEQAGQVLREASRILVAGGTLILGTINRTWSAWFWALVVAESSGLVPRGTHSYDLFRSPSDLENLGRSAGLSLVALQGERPKIWSTIRHWAIDLEKHTSVAVTFTMVFSKAC